MRPDRLAQMSNSKSLPDAPANALGGRKGGHLVKATERPPSSYFDWLNQNSQYGLSSVNLRRIPAATRVRGAHAPPVDVTQPERKWPSCRGINAVPVEQITGLP